MASNSAGAERSSEEAAHEPVMNGVSDVLLKIEHYRQEALRLL